MPVVSGERSCVMVANLAGSPSQPSTSGPRYDARHAFGVGRRRGRRRSRGRRSSSSARTPVRTGRGWRPAAEPVDAALGGRLLAALPVGRRQRAGRRGREDPDPGAGRVPARRRSTGLGAGATRSRRRPSGCAGPSARRCARCTGHARRPDLRRRRIDPTELRRRARRRRRCSAGYRFAGYKSGAVRDREPAPVEIAVAGPTARTARGRAPRARSWPTAIADARDLVNTPPNDLYPPSFADRLAALASRPAGRGRGARRAGAEPRAATAASWPSAAARPAARGWCGCTTARPGRAARVALVGEGTTFNSGGLNLKTTQMSWTKADMAGAAAAAIAVLAAAAAASCRSRSPRRCRWSRTCPRARPTARPTSCTLRGGRTVEVTDTEPSGRHRSWPRRSDGRSRTSRTT